MRFVFTSDDVGGARGRAPIEWFEAVVDWLDGRGIPGTFFWIPRPGGRPSDEDANWLNPILRAKAGGHDFQLHGLTHHCLEFGLPHESIRRHAPKSFEEYEANREKYEKEHSLDEQRRKFGEAAAIYRRAFGESPLIFRAPCLGIGVTAYRAMYESGIRYSSSRSINPAATGYMITRKPELEPWQPDYDGRPFEEPPGVTEIPCLEDLVIGGFEADEYDLALNLFQREISNTIESLGDAAFGVFASHYNRIGKQIDLIPRLYGELFDWMAAEHGITEWTTFKGELA
ncbi:MAG: DUF2334 domain-containing protein [Planctomycetes bacterium]|nr:DUF2334 domain-containing protein [Planctomycetota bacterium]